MSKLRRKFSGAFKAKVALEALRERDTIESLSKKHDVHPNQILRRKKELMENGCKVFSSDTKPDQSARLIDELYRQTGQLKVDNDWLKKSCHDAVSRKKIYDRAW
jgi:transposase-like protein